MLHSKCHKSTSDWATAHSFDAFCSSIIGLAVCIHLQSMLCGTLCSFWALKIIRKIFKKHNLKKFKFLSHVIFLRVFRNRKSTAKVSNGCDGTKNGQGLPPGYCNRWKMAKLGNVIYEILENFTVFCLYLAEFVSELDQIYPIPSSWSAEQYCTPIAKRSEHLVSRYRL